MSRPSLNAILAARSAVSTTPQNRVAVAALRAAHDPKLGLDRSVCLRDVVEFVKRSSDEWFYPPEARQIEQHFTREDS